MLTLFRRRPEQRRARRLRQMRYHLAVLALLLAGGADAAPPRPVSDEARTAAYFDRIASDPSRLRIFLQKMPKGGDLHNHPGGSVYAEDFLRWAGEEGLCVSTTTFRVVEPPCDAEGKVAAAGLEGDYARYSRALDTLSTRGFEGGIGDRSTPGFDRFFSSFDGFAAVKNVPGVLAADRAAAAASRVSYLELLTAPGEVASLYPVAERVSGDGTDFEALSRALAPLIPAAVSAARATFDGYEARARALGNCSSPQPAPGCRVVVRFQFAALRSMAPARVFAQLAFGFALAQADRRFAGVNIVMPEHDPVAVRDYGLHMRMIAFLKARHSSVPLSLHAGELAFGMVPPRDLSFHIHDAVLVAGARRIGHGVDIAFEEGAPALLRKMAAERIAVEINLTSNAVILGVKGDRHPMALYRAMGVPVVISTDDQGVARSDMTNEYMRAATEQHLRYYDLKQAARDSLQYAFVDGASLWLDRPGGRKVPTCMSTTLTPACGLFLKGSTRATLQWELEQDFRSFEKSQPALGL